MTILSIIVSLIVGRVALFIGMGLFTSSEFTFAFCQTAVIVTMGGFIMHDLEKLNKKIDGTSENKENP